MNRYRFLFFGAVIALASLSAPFRLDAAVTIVSGNGQLNVPPPLQPQYFPFFQPLVVKVTDANGAPQPFASVTWNITSGAFGATLGGGTVTLTDVNGLASNTIFFSIAATQASAGQFYTQTTITASTADASATFVETLGFAGQAVGPNAFLQPVSVTPGQYLQNILGGERLAGQSGSTGSTPITVRVQTASGFGVQNVSLQLVSYHIGSDNVASQDASGPIVRCLESQGGTNMVLTDANGNASCTPQFGGAPGTGQFYVLMGAGAVAPTDPLTPPLLLLSLASRGFDVTPASPASIRITQGNNQTVNPSQTVPVPLQVEVDGATGNPLSGQVVRWTATPANMVSIAASDVATDSNGKSTTSIQVLGNATGSITVRATLVSNSSLSSTFTITVVPVVTITGFTAVSGNNQSAAVGTAFSQPLVVQVTTSSGSAANVPVQFQTNGSVSLSATSVNTDSNGRAQVTVTAGSITGPVSVNASVASSTGIGSQSFSLTVLPPAPAVGPTNFINGADYQQQSLSPCSIGAVAAASLGVTNAAPTFPGQPLANSDARLTINNVGAPILSIGLLPNGQQAISFQVPCETAPGSAVPSILTLNGQSVNVNLNIQAASPGIFQTINSDGVLRAVVIRPDGSSVTLTNPARRGENASIFVTGLGATAPPVGTSSAPSAGTTANAQGTIVVGMAGSGVSVVSARLSEDLPGVFRVTFSIPADIQTGNNVSISVASIPSGSSTPIYSATTKINVQ